MIIGATMSGKSTVYNSLRAAINILNKEGNQKFLKVESEVLNPKSITMNELYGFVDVLT